ncbi:MAG: prephenate dehydrogenase/arogenate dehydrogenase family protein, partial [Alphaproteobacteria bacterium]|nr:prephenate dehydrogenase/arogenate dehydrogenase family protein [Alphaproteobacteria bacterium]
MNKDSLGLIGVGSFGSFAAHHLSKHFDLVLHDAGTDATLLARDLKACCGDLNAAAVCDIVVLAVPVQKIRQVLTDIAPMLKPNALVIDVCSVKIKPVQAMLEILPETVSI